MAFKRALWSSGLTYKHTCEGCGSTVIYKDDKLDFRPWFADGFVYCPKCTKPLRHNENLAIDGERPVPKTFDLCGDAHSASPHAHDSQRSPDGYCTQCGKPYSAGDKFCSGCGAKKI